MNWNTTVVQPPSSMNNRLLDEVIQQGLQTFFDRLLIVQRASEQGVFELLIRTHGRIQLGVGGRVGCAASVQKLLAAQSRQYGIRVGDDFVDETVNHVQRILLGTIANRTNAQFDRRQATAYPLDVAVDFLVFA